MPDGSVGASQALPLTGERTMPGIWHENYWFRRHEIVYQWVARTLADNGAGSGPQRRGGPPPPRLGPTRSLFDAGCGEGYGAELLRRSTGAAVVALDYDQLAATHVRRSYPHVPVVRGNLVRLPFADRVFDGAVSLQTVEHLWDQEAFVAECARVTRPGGGVVLSTPNRLTFPPGNICHARELTGAELRALLTTPALDLTLLTGLHHGERIVEWERRYGNLVNAQLAAPPSAWPAHLAEFVSSLSADDFVLDSTDLDSALDLLAVARVTG
ncbi:class I SAM-dependent methyltransferase [Actinopolymorpha alba]|uniref:class I SAM-dependent methyltransferase n=1 Tax=Actinopolymorpha alba TaxID=533267 RepID=UPI00036E40DB|nr:class I SAM-dependent methyltransferase [Actinopolymorpha alba]